MTVFNHPLATYLTRLRTGRNFNEADRDAFFSLQAHVSVHPAGATIVSQGSAVDSCIFLIDGFITRTKFVKTKRRQILAFCIPGDAVDLQSLFLEYADHTLETHASSTVAVVTQKQIVELMNARPNVMRAFWLEVLVEAAISREWALNLGQRTARQRIAHLLLETETRYEIPTRAGRGTFQLPITQAVLASALGLSLVHLNKSLQWLRNEGFLSVQGRTYEITRRDDLVDFCDFDPTYLHDKIARPSGEGTGHLDVTAVSV